MEKSIERRIFKVKPALWHFDWVACVESKGIPGMRYKITSVIEFKSRTKTNHNQFSHYMIDFVKWKKLREISAELSIHAFLLVEFADGFYLVDAECPDVEVGIGGREDRGDAMDLEPCAFIPTEHFVRVNCVKKTVDTATQP